MGGAAYRESAYIGVEEKRETQKLGLHINILCVRLAGWSHV